MAGSSEICTRPVFGFFRMTRLAAQLGDWIAPLVVWAAVMSALVAVVAVLLEPLS
jgi:hypothetical protein